MCSLAKSRGVAALCRDELLPETFDLTVVVPSLGAADFSARYGQLLNVCRFIEIFLDSRSKELIERRGVRHDTDIERV